MATIHLVRGMGSFFKECDHPESRWPRCPHDDKIRYRNAAGRQAEESGFSTQEKVKARLAEVYQARKNSPQNQHKAERIQKYSPMRFEQSSTPPSGRLASATSAPAPCNTSTHCSPITSTPPSRAAGWAPSLSAPRHKHRRR
ncbi:hypothetical protein ACFY9Y_06750 [Streptomyces fimicarius]|uniref:hypothetical protein n=1 Tax=Streptomyces griseus TaxID=1911 RepID=UPI0036EC20D0